MPEENHRGGVYITTNPEYEHLIKFGYTYSGTQERLAQLSSSTGVPAPFEERMYIECEDCKYIDESFQKLNRIVRRYSRREFYAMTVKEARDSAIRLIHAYETGGREAVEAILRQSADEETRADAAAVDEAVSEASDGGREVQPIVMFSLIQYLQRQHGNPWTRQVDIIRAVGTRSGIGGSVTSGIRKGYIERENKRIRLTPAGLEVTSYVGGISSNSPESREWVNAHPDS